jgi:5-methylcytosine-specific restriction protein A
MQGLDHSKLAALLSARFALELESGVTEVWGGRFVFVRPKQPAEPNGFSIMLARTPRQAEATLQLDRFAGVLRRTMAEADAEARQEFISLASSLAGEEGVKVTVSADERPLSSVEEFLDARFEQLDIECTVRIPRTAASELAEKPLLTAATGCLGLVLSLVPVKEGAPVEDSEVEGLPEGARMTVLVNRYERSPGNRAVCLAHHGACCFVCGFDFEAFYGDLGAGYCEVHHRVPVSRMGGSYRINPVRDLVPICSNCHSMIHRKQPPLEPEALRQLVESRKGIAGTSTRI